MTAHESIPAFGNRSPATTYELRRGGYGLIWNEAGELAVVVTTAGAFLPGGGQEAGESPQQALRREAREECGLVIEVGEFIAIADEFVISLREGKTFQKRCTFFNATVAGPPVAAVECDHELRWWPAAKALRELCHESQRWALQQALQRQARPSAPGELMK